MQDFIRRRGYALLCLVAISVVANADEPPPTSAVSLYASFDEKVAADFGGGALGLQTRSDHPQRKGQYIFREGIPTNIFQITEGNGVANGALECLDVLPKRGRIFFPAKGNMAFQDGGWGGSISMWINTNPDTLFKTSFCDPVQVTHKGAHDGGLWIDFPDQKPRDMRMGIFPALKPGEKPLKESDPNASIVRLNKVGFRKGDWHHLALSWDHFDTGKANGNSRFYVDGKLIGEVKDRKLSMEWDLEKTGIYIAVSFIGLMDEFAVFNRPLTAREIAYLHKHPGYLNKWQRSKK